MDHFQIPHLSRLQRNPQEPTGCIKLSSPRIAVFLPIARRTFPILTTNFLSIILTDVSLSPLILKFSHSWRETRLKQWHERVNIYMPQIYSGSLSRKLLQPLMKPRTCILYTGNCAYYREGEITRVRRARGRFWTSFSVDTGALCSPRSGTCALSIKYTSETESRRACLGYELPWVEQTALTAGDNRRFAYKIERESGGKIFVA